MGLTVFSEEYTRQQELKAARRAQWLKENGMTERGKGFDGRYKRRSPEELRKIHQEEERKRERKRAALEALAAKLERIAKMREDRKSYKEIAEHFGVTRQRIEQLITTHLPHLKTHRPVSKHPFINVECSVCKKPISRQERKSGRYYCGRGCFLNGIRKYSSRAESERAQRIKFKERYKNDPAVRERHRLAVDRYMAKVKSDPKRWREFRRKQDAYIKEWHKRKMQDPIYRQKQRDEWKRRYYGDPKFRARIIEYGRQYDARQRQKREEEALDEIFTAAVKKGLIDPKKR